MKFGFAVRKNHKDNMKHLIMGTYTPKTVDFCHQINLNYQLSWGILKCVIEGIYDQADQEESTTVDYCLYLDPNPNKFELKLYLVTPDEIEDEDENDDGL